MCHVDADDADASPWMEIAQAFDLCASVEFRVEIFD